MLCLSVERRINVDFLLSWIKGIMGCLLVMSLILQCVPGKIYRPYLRLFMGIVLILTILSPLTNLTGWGSALETMVGALSYREEIPGWEEKLLKGEEWIEGQIADKAEEMSQQAAENTLKYESGMNSKETTGEENERGETQCDEGKISEIRIEVEITEIPPVNLAGGE